MFRLAAVFLLLSAALPASWVRVTSGPFEVITDQREREAREALSDLEQFRHAFGVVLGKPDLRSDWPIRVLLFRSQRDYEAYALPAGLALARDVYTGAARSREPMPVELRRALARILLESNTGRLPGEIETGLVELFSTLRIDGMRITLGDPPPPAARHKSWAKIHMLTVTPTYYGRLRVLVGNLEQAVAPGPGYRNAFSKPAEEIAAEAEAYLQAGDFSTAPIMGRAMNPDREFTSGRTEEGFPEIALADLRLASGAHAAEARAAYRAVLQRNPASPEANEGLGLLALYEGRKEEALRHFATRASARAHFEYALLEPDPNKRRAALEKAAELNPRWGSPHFEMAQREADPRQKIQHLNTAAKLAPRNAGWWQALAEAHEAENQFVEAAQAWASAEAAATSEEERVRIHSLRADIEQKRIEHEIAEKRRREEDERRKIEELKEKARASIRAALEAASRGSEPDPDRVVVEWWEDETGEREKIRGALERVDCLGSQLRLVIATRDRGPVRLLIADPSKVVIAGRGEATFQCGPQRPARQVSVEYVPKPDPKLDTAGEVAMIDFP